MLGAEIDERQQVDAGVLFDEGFIFIRNSMRKSMLRGERQKQKQSGDQCAFGDA
jgi:hypothetical protein